MRTAGPVALLVAVVLAACGEEPADSGARGVVNDAAIVDAASPSFDCAKSDTEATDIVCETPMLARMDNELQRLYALAESGTYVTPERLEELVAMQRGWIKGRDDCWKADDKKQCITASYAMRIHELRQGFFDARQQDEKGISAGPLALACDGADYGVSATFIKAGPGVVFLQWLDRAVTLVQTTDGPDARYTGIWDGTETTLSIKGNNARFTPLGGTKTTCRIEEIG